MTSNFASRFSGVPALVAVGHEGWLESQITSLDAAIAKAAADPETVRQFRDESAEAAEGGDKFWGEEGSFMSMLRPYKVREGVLHVPVAGMLMHDFPYAAFGMATGYEYIVKAVERGVADPDVSSIALVINSGGGTVAGCFDAVDRIYNARGEKPIVATVNEHSYSAAYAIASAADKITLPRAGGVGSIGVVTSHVDESEALNKAGVKVTFIHAGAHKVDGNSTEPLSDAVRDRIQTRIDGLYDIFVSTVSRNLGIEESAIRETEAQVFSANEAVSLGLAHEIRAHDEALTGLSGQFTTVGEAAMSQPNQAPRAATPAASADQAEVSRESLDAARAEGRTEGAQAERERIQGILNSEEAKGRDGLANHFAMNTDMSIESAVAALAASPKADAAPAAQTTPGASFESAMSRGNPEISPEGGDGEEASGTSDVDSILASFGQASGYRAKH